MMADDLFWMKLALFFTICGLAILTLLCRNLNNQIKFIYSRERANLKFLEAENKSHWKARGFHEARVTKMSQRFFTELKSIRIAFGLKTYGDSGIDIEVPFHPPGPGLTPDINPSDLVPLDPIFGLPIEKDSLFAEVKAGNAADEDAYQERLRLENGIIMT